MKRLLFIGLLGLLGIISSLGVAYGDVINIYAENDCLMQHDYYYTHGTEISYRHENLEYGITQTMYTPKYKFGDIPPYGDRPYAGLLYLTFSDYLYSTYIDRVGIDLGILGPDAYGKETQTWVHERLKLHVPEGWESQIRNQPVININFNKGKLMLQNDYINIYPYYKGDIGTIEDDLRIGSKLLIGWNIMKSKDLNGNQIGMKGFDSHKNIVCYLFSGIEERYVAYNALLDDSIFYSSDAYYHVNSEDFVMNLEYGFALYWKNMGLIVTTDYLSKEFASQDQVDKVDSWKGYNSLKLSIGW